MEIQELEKQLKQAEHGKKKKKKKKKLVKLENHEIEAILQAQIKDIEELIERKVDEKNYFKNWLEYQK